MTPPPGPAGLLARLLLRTFSWFVPADERRGWREGWFAELSELERRRRGGRAVVSRLAFVLGALPHSLWERKEWTMSILLQDVRYALRVLLRAPTFSLLAVGTVALGVGASTTVFSLVSSTVLRPPAGISNPDTVVQLGRYNEDGFDSFAYPYVRAFAGARSLSAVSGYVYRTLLVGRGDSTLPTVGQLVTGDYFTLLGLDTAAGGTFGSADPGEPQPVVVISARLAIDRFGSVDAAPGSELDVNGRPYRVLGVLEPGFHGTDIAQPPADLWLPLDLAGQVLGGPYANFDQPGFSWLWVLGRLREGVAVDAAHDEIDAIYRSHFQEHWGEAADTGTLVVPGPGLRPEEREQLSSIVTLLLAIVAAVMVVASANLGSLMLARAGARVREMGLRAAMGASRARLARQLLTESVLLSLAGGAVAIVATFWTARLLPAFIPWRLGVEITLDSNVFAFGVACSVLVGMLFGGLPALRGSSGDVVDALREGGSRAGTGGVRLRRGLVVGQLALSFALLVSVGLLLESLRAAERADPGFATRDVLVSRLDLDLAGFEPEEGEAFRRALLERVSTLPGVEAAALGTNVPFAGWSRQSVVLPEPLDGEEFLQFDTTSVSADYFATLEMPLLRGDGFSSADPLPPHEAIVSESTARLLAPDTDPLGATFDMPDGDFEATVPIRIVGIVADVRNRGLRIDPRPSIYFSDQFRYRGRMALFVRGRGVGPADVRRAVSAIAPEVSLLSSVDLHQSMADSLTDTALVGRLAGVFAALALALAAVGLYGVIAYLASRRTHEVGVRMALGADAGNVLGLIARQGLVLGAIGIGLGVALAFPVTGALRGLLYTVSPRSPMVMLGAAVVLGAVTVAASIVPARWATRIDPARALRAD